MGRVKKSNSFSRSLVSWHPRSSWFPDKTEAKYGKVTFCHVTSYRLPADGGRHQLATGNEAKQVVGGLHPDKTQAAGARLAASSPDKTQGVGARLTASSTEKTQDAGARLAASSPDKTQDAGARLAASSWVVVYFTQPSVNQQNSIVLTR